MKYNHEKYPFPKCDLHFHLDGSMIPEVTWQLAKERNIKLPAETLDEFKVFLIRTADCGDVGEFLARFDIPTAILQDKDALFRTTYATIQNLAEGGLSYVEIRFAPQLHILKGLTQKDAIDAVLEAKSKADKDFPALKTGIILCAMIAPNNNNRELNFETARLFEEYLGKGVVAMDLAGFEDSVPMKEYAEIFESAKKKGLPLTIHAGDNGIPQNVATVIDYGAARVGHGHRCYFDEAVTKKVIETNTALEICLSSKIKCKTEHSYKEHPAKKLLDMGVKVTLNTDNMVFSNVTIDDEYDHALNDCGFTYNDLIQCNINSIESSFMPEEEKTAYIEKLKTFFG